MKRRGKLLDRHISSLVEMLFTDVPYSEEAVKARERIEAALNEEYQKLAEKNSGSNAFETLLEKYSTLSRMAVLAGYTPEDALKWRSFGETKSYEVIKKEMTHQRRRIYLISLLWLFTGVYLLNIILLQNLYQLLFAAVQGILAFILQRKFIRKEKLLTARRKYTTDAYLYMQKLSDRYTKRILNGTALLSAVTAAFAFMSLNFFIAGNSKPTELLESIYMNLIALEIPAYICIKNSFCSRLMRRRIRWPDSEKYRRHLKGMLLFSVIYWILMLAVSVAAKAMTAYPVNIFIAAAVLFVLLVLFYNLKLRSKITYQNIVIKWKKIAVYGIVAVFIAGYMLMRRETWYTQPYINSVPVVAHHEHDTAYDEETGIFTITSSTSDFKILHLTDIHLGGSLYSYSKDMKALKAVYAEIAYTKPDLVIVTGDLTFPLGIMSLSLNNAAPVSQFAAFMRNVDIPWAFTYGNHDTESMAALSENGLDELFKKLSYKTSGNLLYPYVQPDITGRNNQLIEIRNSDGTLNQAVFLLDSNAYTGEGINVYDYIHDDQVEWYADQIRRLNAEEGHTVSSMVFFHIPLQQYRTAYELYEQGSGEVRYFFGENGEKMIDKVCCSDYPSSLFDTMTELGSTKAVFCGHDHYNNMSLEYRGIRLTYGMSIDYLAMPGIENDTEQRGAELITLHADSTWEIRQIPLSEVMAEQ